jgi:hypothetical protein
LPFISQIRYRVALIFNYDSIAQLDRASDF